MIAGVYELKTLTKYIWYDCKCKFDGRKFSSNQKRNNDKCRFECKIHHICEKDVSVKNIIYVKKSILGILLYAVVKMVNT